MVHDAAAERPRVRDYDPDLHPGRGYRRRPSRSPTTAPANKSCASTEIPTPWRPPPRWKIFSPRGRNHGRTCSRSGIDAAAAPSTAGIERATACREQRRARPHRCRSRSSDRRSPRAARDRRRRARPGRGAGPAAASGRRLPSPLPSPRAARRSRSDHRLCSPVMGSTGWQASPLWLDRRSRAATAEDDAISSRSTAWKRATGRAPGAWSASVRLRGSRASGRGGREASSSDRSAAGSGSLSRLRVSVPPGVPGSLVGVSR